MKKTFFILLLSSCLSTVKAQNIFPYKLDSCPTDAFCLDCGDQPAGYDPEQFGKLITKLNQSYDYSKISGKILLQVLIDSLGHGCVLSHTDKSNNPITQNIVKSFNEFNNWMPAKTKGKVEGRTSINLSVQIKNGVLTSKIERVDQKAFMKSFDHPTSPEIYNKQYVYKNEHLKNYLITTWNSQNSNLPNNFDDHITIDKKGYIWLTVDEGLVKFDGKYFVNAGQNITKKPDYFNYFGVACDNSNVKWVFATNNIYSYDDKNWTMYDPKVIGADGGYEIINNEKSGEVFFCTDSGLVINKNGNWTKLNKEKVKVLPSNRIAFAKRDSKNRIWIGTFSGSVLIDENGKETNFNDTQSVLKGKCITSMDEDENGVVYLGLYEFDRKDKAAINNDEGIAICYPGRTIKQFTTSNSGMPFNHVTKVLYDKSEKVLWIATDRAGLVRYDLNDGWENYHNENSALPTSYISDMAFDNQGVLFLATRQGLVQIKRK